MKESPLSGGLQFGEIFLDGGVGFGERHLERVFVA
jgi:hypothetical protein